MDSSERTLIREAARGDEAAFAALMRTHRERVYRVARRVVGSHEAAEDVAQQVFITMFKKLHTFRGDSRLSTWLYRVTTNACYDYLRRQRPATAVEDLDGFPSRDGTARERLTTDETLARVTAHIQMLPPKQRLTVTLRVCEELSFKEVAHAVGCSVNAAKVNYFHGIRRLRDLLQARDRMDHAVRTV